jgi:AGZA family xanthine/uracil permease-like MFS transporter
MVTGICFFVSLFFAPIFASIPPWATGCTLILVWGLNNRNVANTDMLTVLQVGWMMARSVVDINWRYAGDALPAFITLIFMPFSYSIAYGLIA